jgi:hypothetical protein
MLESLTLCLNVAYASEAWRGGAGSIPTTLYVTPMLLPKQNGGVAAPGNYNCCEKIESQQGEFGILAQVDLTDPAKMCMAEAGTYLPNCSRYDVLHGEFRGPVAK